MAPRSVSLPARTLNVREDSSPLDVSVEPTNLCQSPTAAYFGESSFFNVSSSSNSQFPARGCKTETEYIQIISNVLEDGVSPSGKSMICNGQPLKSPMSAYFDGHDAFASSPILVADPYTNPCVTSRAISSSHRDAACARDPADAASAIQQMQHAAAGKAMICNGLPLKSPTSAYFDGHFDFTVSHVAFASSPILVADPCADPCVPSHAISSSHRDAACARDTTTCWADMTDQDSDWKPLQLASFQPVRTPVGQEAVRKTPVPQTQLMEKAVPVSRPKPMVVDINSASTSAGSGTTIADDMSGDELESNISVVRRRRFEKTKLCVQFQNKRSCKRGANCRYAHGDHERKDLPEDVIRFGTLTNTKMCIYFNTPAGCKKGVNCTFAHDTIDLKESWQ